MPIEKDEFDEKHMRMLAANLLINALRDLVTARRHILLGQLYIMGADREKTLATLRFKEALSWLSSDNPGNGEYISYYDVCLAMDLDCQALREHLLGRLEYLEAIPSTLKLYNLIDHKALQESVK